MGFSARASTATVAEPAVKKLKDDETAGIKMLTLDEAKKRVIISEDRKPIPYKKEAELVSRASRVRRLANVVHHLTNAKEMGTIVADPDPVVTNLVTKHIPVRTHWHMKHLYMDNYSLIYSGSAEDLEGAIHIAEKNLVMAREMLQSYIKYGRP